MYKEEKALQKVQLQIEDLSDKHITSVYDLLRRNFEYPWNKKLIQSCNVSKVVLIDSNVVGYICVNTVFDEAQIDMIVIDKNFQNLGIGSFLFKEVIEYLKSIGIKYVFLEVSNKNKKALNFYKKFGFEKLYIRKNYYKDKSDAIIMKLNL